MSKGIEDIAKDWRASPMSNLNWEKCQNQAGCVQGEAGGYFVSAEGFARRGYLKPVKPHPNNALSCARAAREKISADLAHDLDLMVPPATLTQLENAPDGCEKAVVVTLVMFPKQHPWETVKSHVNPDDSQESDISPVALALLKIFSECSPMYVFDTWLNQTDHGDHPHNIVWGYDPKKGSDSSLVFLDYAFSLGYNGEWNNDGWKNIELAKFPVLMTKYLDTERLRVAIENIQNYDEEVINDIVNRIPDTHLDQSQKEIISKGLVERRVLVADTFSGLLEAA